MFRSVYIKKKKNLYFIFCYLFLFLKFDRFSHILYSITLFFLFLSFFHFLFFFFVNTKVGLNFEAFHLLDVIVNMC